MVGASLSPSSFTFLSLGTQLEETSESAVYFISHKIFLSFNGGAILLLPPQSVADFVEITTRDKGSVL